jgi:signal transduction histidine kinase
MALNTGEIAEQRYPWLDEGETQARMKIARIAYFKPWGWVIGAGSYEDEALAATAQIEKAGVRMILTVIILLGCSFLATILIWLWTGKALQTHTENTEP